MANKKILKSQFSGKKWNDYRVISLPIKDLWASVPKAETHKGKPFYSRLAEDIAQNGLHYPLLVVHATRRELIERMKTCEDTFCELPFDESKGNLNVRLYVIWGGSNRVRVAEELGFTHVDCVVVESFNRAVELQRTHRKPYTEKYYIPPRPASFQVSPSELTLENSPPSVSRDALWKNALPKLLEALKQPDAGVNDWINFGICKEALGDHLQAARAFIKAHELDPDKFSTFAYILRNLYLARDFDLLVDYLTYCKHFSPKFTAAFSKEPFFAELFAHEPFKTLADPKQTLPPAEADDPVNEASAEAQEGNNGVMDEAALSVLEEAVKNDPENEEALFSYGLGLKSMERYAEAAETFLKVQGINPRNEAVYSMVFLCLFRSENRDMLLNFANYCVGVSPELIINFSEDPIYSELFQQPEFKEVLDVCKEYRKAELGQQKISSDEVSTLAEGSRDLMQQYEELLKDESMLPILKGIVEKNPADEIAWFNYGTSLQSLERYEEAAEAFFKAQELNPANETVYLAIFDCLFHNRNFDQLLSFAQYCNEVSPSINASISRQSSFSKIFEQEEFKKLVDRSQCREI
ncbi:MAG: tetratricopeptide repeat protein [Pontiellaceae bacterium]|nr:tetratricopeptide repeat protein [Pontiellaceae bacterium]